MPRSIEFEIPHDTALFSPIQLQPRVLMSLTMSAWARWLRAYHVSFPRMIRERRVGFVVVGTRMEFLRPYGFFDADAFTARAHVVVHGGAKLLGVDARFASGGAEVAATYTLVRTVAIEDLESLSAVPCDVPGDLLATFAAEEVQPDVPERRVAAWTARVREAGLPLGRHEQVLVLHRDACEAADQWSFIEVPVIAAAHRERLCLADRGELRSLLGRPLRTVEVELRRPFYVFADVTVATTAARVGGELVFEHQLRSAGGEPHATVIEVLAAPGTAGTPSREVADE